MDTIIQEDRLCKNPLMYYHVNLSPWMARAFLRSMAINRKLRPYKIKKYAMAMRRGEWVRNGQAFLFTRNLIMVDGQHRCHAVILCGLTVEATIAIGVPQDYFDRIDQGLTRQASDTMELLEVPHARDAGPAVLYLWQFQNQLLGDTRAELRPSQVQLHETANLHPGLSESYQPASPLFGLVVRSQALFLHYILSRKDATAATVFCQYLGTGLNLSLDGDTQPIYILRRMFIDNLREKKPYTVAERLYLCMMAWNDWRQGRKKRNYLLGRWDYQTWPRLV